MLCFGNELLAQSFCVRQTDGESAPALYVAYPTPYHSGRNLMSTKTSVVSATLTDLLAECFAAIFAHCFAPSFAYFSLAKIR
jgi:hypothetical protein